MMWHQKGAAVAARGILPMLQLYSIRVAATLALALAAPAGTVLAQQMPPCANDIMPLRQQVEKDGAAVKAAIEKKDRAEICNALKRFTATEAKFVKYMEEHGAWCGVPPEVMPQLKKNQAHAIKLRGQACAAGAAGPAIPAGPGLSEALGTTRAPTGKIKSGTGTFDTLSGPAAQQ
jgi:hypothetical protein